jgi:Methyltransferase domain
MQPANARRIAKRGHRIAGWFSDDAAALFAMLDSVQRDAGVTGDLFEIGVHHGRSCVLLCAMAGPGESVGACDLFGRQELNVSRSGAGDRAIFERNVAELVPGFERLVVHETSSAELRAEDVGGPYRLFHVDGGHSCEEALGDLRLGAQVLHDRGALVVDDPYRVEWPGVTEAILRFLDERDDFSAIAVGFNKAVLMRDDARAPYERALADPWAYFDRLVYEFKTAPIAGRPATVFYVPPYRQAPRLEPAVARMRSLHGWARHRLTAARERRR